MTDQNDESTGNPEAGDIALSKRLDSIGWALFLIMIGGLWLAPEGTVPEGTWLVGTGLIILGLTVVRHVKHVTVSGFWVIIGILALGSGISNIYGLELPVFPILVILLGAGIILEPLIKKMRS
ncbi:MAG: hypothetical protein JSU70_00665 [Phycisphaerales bacterium]|nr:MAG: hypothetical protein JSU70_00665 [Phycisphaerales bacterium]